MEPQMTTLPQILAQQPSIGAPLEIPSFITDFANSCVLQITGLPKNVTQQELLSLYAPVMHLLSVSQIKEAEILIFTKALISLMV